MTLSVRRVGPESAEVVLAIVRDAFGSRPPLNPPADALLETQASIGTRLALGGGLVARIDNEPVGALLLDLVGDTMYLRRFGVTSAAQGQGVAGALIRAAVEAATGRATIGTPPTGISAFKSVPWLSANSSRPGRDPASTIAVHAI